MNTPPQSHAVRGCILHFLSDPEGTSEALEYFDDGLLVFEQGYITKLGNAQEIIPQLTSGTRILDRRGQLILPGFIDCHTHYVQTDIIASWGRRLLDWLEDYTFPAEAAFADPAHALATAEFFLDELLRNGTTTAVVMGSVHAISADTLFQAAARRNQCLIAGKVMMDRNCPEHLRDTPQSAYDDSKALIQTWHGKDRLQYAISPRFAPTSSDEQLALAADLAREHPDVYLHTHLAENAEELAWVKSLYPNDRSYLEVYHRFGLLRNRSLMAHGIWLDQQDQELLADTRTALVHCPTCNLFMGSGLFDLAAADEAAGVHVGLGTDVGGGTTFSMLQVLNETYKVAQLRQHILSPEKAFYMATLGGARTLDLEAHLGNFLPGKAADFLVFDNSPTPLLERRLKQAENIQQKLFLLMMLGDDRAVDETYVAGERCWHKKH